jgi:hypothetical protein
MKPTITLITTLLLEPLATLHAVEPANLRCEYKTNPTGIDAEKPSLSWKISDPDSEIIK